MRVVYVNIRLNMTEKAFADYDKLLTDAEKAKAWVDSALLHGDRGVDVAEVVTDNEKK